MGSVWDRIQLIDESARITAAVDDVMDTNVLEAWRDTAVQTDTIQNVYGKTYLETVQKPPSPNPKRRRLM